MNDGGSRVTYEPDEILASSRDSRLNQLVALLGYGSSIAPDILESCFGFDRNTSEYRFRALALCEKVKKLLLEQGKVATVRLLEVEGLRVLTPNEASHFQESRGRASREKQYDVAENLVGIDRSLVQPDRLRDHDRAVAINGRMAAALRAEGRKRLPDPSTPERKTPGKR